MRDCDCGAVGNVACGAHRDRTPLEVERGRAELTDACSCMRAVVLMSMYIAPVRLLVLGRGCAVGAHEDVTGRLRARFVFVFDQEFSWLRTRCHASSMTQSVCVHDQVRVLARRRAGLPS